MAVTSPYPTMSGAPVEGGGGITSWLAQQQQRTAPMNPGQAQPAQAQPATAYPYPGYNGATVNGPNGNGQPNTPSGTPQFTGIPGSPSSSTGAVPAQGAAPVAGGANYGGVLSNNVGGSNGTGTSGIPTNGNVATVQSSVNPQAYTQAITQSLAPTFQNQNAQLLEQENALGILPSGATNKNLQDLTAQQSATIAGQVAPLIQQGYAQQYGANTQNASAQNAYSTMLQQQAYGAGQNQINNNLQAQEFNAGAGNTLQLAQLGYNNSDYQQMMAQLAGLTSQGLSSTDSIYGQGTQQQLNAYTNGYQSLLPYLNQTGQGAGYATGTANGATGAVNTTDPYASPASYLNAVNPNGTTYAGEPVGAGDSGSSVDGNLQQ